MNTTSLKPFDLEKALAGDPVITRDGNRVLELHLFKSLKLNDNLLVVIDDNSYKTLSYYPNGKFRLERNSCEDLFMAHQSKTFWVNVYGNFITNCIWLGSLYSSEDDAKHYSILEQDYIKTMQINIEV